MSLRSPQKPILSVYKLVSAIAFAILLSLVPASYAGPCGKALGKKDLVSIEFTPATYKEPASLLIKDTEDSRFIASGTVTKYRNKNWLALVLILKTKEGERSKNLRGQKAIQIILKEFAAKNIKIDGFVATWTDNMKTYDAPSDNLITFAKTYKKAYLEKTGESVLPEVITPDTSNKIAAISAEAAKSTWTAKQVDAMGFKQIEEIEVIDENNRVGSDGYPGKVTIRVFWSNTTDRNLYFIDSGSRGKSALPRLHQFIEYITSTFE